MAMNTDEFLNYITKLQTDFSTQQKELFQESEQLSARASTLVSIVQSTTGSINTCNEFITDETPEDDAHRLKLTELTETYESARTELAATRSRLSQLMHTADALRGSIGVLAHLSQVHENGLPTDAEGAPPEVADTVEPEKSAENVQ